MKKIYLTVRSLELDRLTCLWYHSGYFPYLDFASTSRDNRKEKWLLSGQDL